MQGESRFSKQTASEIRDLLRSKLRADRDEQKRIRHKLRRLRFYISDFTGVQDGFTTADFDNLVRRGTVKVVDEPEARE